MIIPNRRSFASSAGRRITDHGPVGQQRTLANETWNRPWWTPPLQVWPYVLTLLRERGVKDSAVRWRVLRAEQFLKHFHENDAENSAG
ncbi:MAG TPA: hypothetical protein VJ834_15110 [Burkholderiales bacterium]|nr:hypothetical protein [Burkholderiales bacterium]